MAILKTVGSLNYASRFFSDENLTKKAYLNALAAALDYAARLLVGFFVMPWMVAGLGDYFYGTWQILNRMIGYISPASGRPTQALKWTLANRQASTDYEEKRHYVGSAISVWILFLPVMAVFGGVLAWFAPYGIKNTPVELFWSIRLTTGVLVANLAMTSLADMPHSVLEGENLGYKRMGMSTVLVFVGGGFTWLALYFHTGIIGVAVAALAITLLTGAFFLRIVRTYAPWFGVARPSFKAIRQFFGLSWWFLGWNLIMNLMTASDVVILGVLVSAESVTNYSLTKYAPETLISIVAMVAFGIAPGLGSIIGSGDLKKAAGVRGEIMSLTWLVVTALGSTILLWNRALIGLWVGPRYFAGSIPTLLIMVMVTQFVLIRNDANFIDLTLNLRTKVLMGAFSAVLSLCLAGVLVSYSQAGVSGLCLGFIAGRSILSLVYPFMVGRFLKVPLSSQLKSALRPALATATLFCLALKLDTYLSQTTWFDAGGWVILALLVGVTFGGMWFLAFCIGLSGAQRKLILRRVRMVIAATSR
jgi:O-antigen/teichoic acid export membrane protein